MGGCSSSKMEWENTAPTALRGTITLLDIPMSSTQWSVVTSSLVKRRLQRQARDIFKDMSTSIPGDMKLVFGESSLGVTLSLRKVHQSKTIYTAPRPDPETAPPTIKCTHVVIYQWKLPTEEKLSVLAGKMHGMLQSEEISKASPPIFDSDNIPRYGGSNVTSCQPLSPFPRRAEYGYSVSPGAERPARLRKPFQNTTQNLVTSGGMVISESQSSLSTMSTDSMFDLEDDSNTGPIAIRSSEKLREDPSKYDLTDLLSPASTKLKRSGRTKKRGKPSLGGSP